MDSFSRADSNFASLSLKDLAEARDLFHFHLLNKRNVVATALGLYRIRKSDPWPSERDRAGAKPRQPRSKARTLFNSEVRPYSWPCVYVFVSSWEDNEKVAERDPSDVVPPGLWLPDGRVVPVCVIEARKQPWSQDLRVKGQGAAPRNLMGPGSAILNPDGQGLPRVATAGAIVRDAERYYVLTNRHAVGDPGNPIEVLMGNREQKVGVAARKGLGREDFRAIYPAFQSTRQRLLMDVGLVEVDDILAWKTTVPGIAPVGPVLDLYDNSLSLQLINRAVVGQSAVSGKVRGEVHGLFYRYKAMGGSEYIADFLIGPATRPSAEAADAAPAESFAVHHGDSGTVLYLEQPAAPGGVSYRPFAILWGRQEFFEGESRLTQPFALATSLSTALDRLDLDLVQDINLDQDYVWGWVGHYTIGRALAVAGDLITSAKLKTFITANIDLLSLNPNAALNNDPKVLDSPSQATPNFVPLADVPDNVWKGNVNFTMVDAGGPKKKHKTGPGSRGGNDNPNHFADLDLPYAGAQTFLELNSNDPDTYLQPSAWIAYFKSLEPRYDAWAVAMGKPGDTSKHWGALPFRVHQLFDVMAKAAKDKTPDLFLLAGGVMIHYLGDACQPLHASYLSQGDPDRVVGTSTGSKKLEADGVHSGYEDAMVAFGYTQQNLATAMAAKIADLAAAEPMPAIGSGYDASKAVIALIAATQGQIKPSDIVAKWVELSGQSAKDKAARMWDAFGDDTVTCMARGTRYLTALWQAAWTLGGGDANIPAATQVTEAALIKLYNDPAVCRSVALDHYPANAAVDWSALT